MSSESKEGYLLKRGGRLIARWQKRYFVLRGTVLEYYKDASFQGRKKTLGQIELRQAAIAVVLPGQACDREFAFRVAPSQGSLKIGQGGKIKSYVFVSESIQERAGWMRMLRSAAGPTKTVNPRLVGFGRRLRKPARSDAVESQDSSAARTSVGRTKDTSGDSSADERAQAVRRKGERRRNQKDTGKKVERDQNECKISPLTPFTAVDPPVKLELPCGERKSPQLHSEPTGRQEKSAVIVSMQVAENTHTIAHTEAPITAAVNERNRGNDDDGDDGDDGDDDNNNNNAVTEIPSSSSEADSIAIQPNSGQAKSRGSKIHVAETKKSQCADGMSCCTRVIMKDYLLVHKLRAGGNTLHQGIIQVLRTKSLSGFVLRHVETCGHAQVRVYLHRGDALPESTFSLLSSSAERLVSAEHLTERVQELVSRTFTLNTLVVLCSSVADRNTWVASMNKISHFGLAAVGLSLYAPSPLLSRDEMHSNEFCFAELLRGPGDTIAKPPQFDWKTRPACVRCHSQYMSAFDRCMRRLMRAVARDSVADITNGFAEAESPSSSDDAADDDAKSKSRPMRERKAPDRWRRFRQRGYMLVVGKKTGWKQQHDHLLRYAVLHKRRALLHLFSGKHEHTPDFVVDLRRAQVSVNPDARTIFALVLSNTNSAHDRVRRISISVSASAHDNAGISGEGQSLLVSARVPRGGMRQDAGRSISSSREAGVRDKASRRRRVPSGTSIALMNDKGVVESQSVIVFKLEDETDARNWVRALRSVTRARVPFARQPRDLCVDMDLCTDSSGSSHGVSANVSSPASARGDNAIVSPPPRASETCTMVPPLMPSQPQPQRQLEGAGSRVNDAESVADVVDRDAEDANRQLFSGLLKDYPSDNFLSSDDDGEEKYAPDADDITDDAESAEECTDNRKGVRDKRSDSGDVQSGNSHMNESLNDSDDEVLPLQLLQRLQTLRQSHSNSRSEIPILGTARHAFSTQLQPAKLSLRHNPTTSTHPSLSAFRSGSVARNMDVAELLQTDRLLERTMSVTAQISPGGTQSDHVARRATVVADNQGTLLEDTDNGILSAQMEENRRRGKSVSIQSTTCAAHGVPSISTTAAHHSRTRAASHAVISEQTLLALATREQAARDEERSLVNFGSDIAQTSVQARRATVSGVMYAAKAPVPFGAQSFPANVTGNVQTQDGLRKHLAKLRKELEQRRGVRSGALGTLECDETVPSEDRIVGGNKNGDKTRPCRRASAMVPAMWNLPNPSNLLNPSSNPSDPALRMHRAPGLGAVTNRMQQYPSHEEVQSRGCRELNKLARKPAMRRRIAISGAIEIVVAAMSRFSCNPSLQRSACAFLCKLSFDTALAAAMGPLHVLNALNCALRAYSSTDHKLLMSGIMCIRNLTVLPRNKKRVLYLDVAVLDAVLDCMKVHESDAAVQSAALVVLINLSHASVPWQPQQQQQLAPGRAAKQHALRGHQRSISRFHFHLLERGAAVAIKNTLKVHADSNPAVVHLAQLALKNLSARTF